MDLISTLPGSLMEGFLPAGWDLAEIDRLAALPPDQAVARRAWWHAQFEPVSCASVEDFDVLMGHEIAREIQLAGQSGRPIAFILPVGPMGMYRWTVYFLTEWGVHCDHVHGFNMDEWSDRDGETLPPGTPGGFQHAMEQAFYGPLGKNTVPAGQRHFARKTELPAYAGRITDLKKRGQSWSRFSASAASATSPSGNRISPQNSPLRRSGSARRTASAPGCIR